MPEIFGKEALIQALELSVGRNQEMVTELIKDVARLEQENARLLRELRCILYRPAGHG